MNAEKFLWFLFYLMPSLYLFSAIAYVVVFVTEHPTVQRLARGSLFVAVLVNLVFFSAFTTHFGHIPMVTAQQVIGNVGFAVAAIYLWIQNLTKTPHSGPFILTLVVLCQIVGVLNPRFDRVVPEILDSAMFSVHVIVALLGYSALALAGVYGFIYLLLYKEIRFKRFGLVFRRLPPLEVLDRMNFIATTVGFAFLTVAIATGISWAARVYEDKLIDPKLIVGVLTWLFYGATVVGRKYRSWRGSRFAYSSSLGFTAVLLLMFAVNSFFTKFHVFS